MALTPAEAGREVAETTLASSSICALKSIFDCESASESDLMASARRRKKAVSEARGITTWQALFPSANSG